MTRTTRRVSVVMVLMFVALLANLVYVQVVKAPSYVGKPGNQVAHLPSVVGPRGTITAGGVTLASSTPEAGSQQYLRHYADGPLYAAVTGYDSPVYGLSGMEQAAQSTLTGQTPALTVDRLERLVTGQVDSGGSVALTIDPAVQKAAYDAMADSHGAPRAGAVVALNPTTGAILAAVSTPSYDPNVLAGGTTADIQSQWKKLTADTGDPLVNRVFSAVYPAGSTFKIVTAAAALGAGLTPQSEVFAPVGFWPFAPKNARACPATQGTSCVQNFNGEQCRPGSTTATLAYAFAKSCNTAFANLAVAQFGGAALAAQAKLFGFTGPYSGTSIPDLCTSPTHSVPIPVCKSSIGLESDITDAGSLSHTAFGQQDVRMTPLEGAMLAAAVANGGTLMTPYLVAQTTGPGGKVLSHTTPSALGQVVDPAADAELKSLMVDVVTQREGTGSPAAINEPGIVVGGKTGTADTGFYSNGSTSQPDAWFVGFALRNGAPAIAVAVLVEHGGNNGNEVTGGLAAGPVAKAVMTAYLDSAFGQHR